MDWILILAILVIVAVVSFSPNKEHYQTVRFVEPPKQEKTEPMTNYEAALTRPIPAELLPKPCVDPQDYSRGPMLPTSSKETFCEGEIQRRSNELYYKNYKGGASMSVAEAYDSMVEDYRHEIGGFNNVQGALDDKYNKYAF